MAPAVLFVFVITDSAVANGVLDFLTGKTAAADAAALATVSAKSEELLHQVQGIDTSPPHKPNSPG